MLRHVVMWTVHRPEDRAPFAAALESCRGLVPGMREFDVGVKSEGLEADHDVVLVATFDDEAALEAYLAHPHHRTVATGLATMRASRAVLDYFTTAPGDQAGAAAETPPSNAPSTASSTGAATNDPQETP